jgi:hypothetical protein
MEDPVEEREDDEMLEPVLEREELVATEELLTLDPVLDSDELMLEPVELRLELELELASHGPNVSPWPICPGTASSGTSMVSVPLPVW